MHLFRQGKEHAVRDTKPDLKISTDSFFGSRALDQQGMTIGSHSWSHKDMTTLNWNQIHDELWRVEEAMIRILGKVSLYRVQADSG